MAADVTVVIPFESDDPVRGRIFQHICNYYSYEFPVDWGFLVVHDWGRPFSRSIAVNRGVEVATSDIIVINDADTLVRPEQLREAVAYARGAPGLVYAYTRYRRLTRQATESLATYKEAFYGEVEWQLEMAPSQSVVAIRRADFDAIGGMDEGFVDWGYEDIEFAYRAAVYAPLRRINGDLYHLWHGDRDPATDAPLSADAVQVRKNFARMQRLVK